MALLNYPILMAADILAYKADAVPVGDDQLPHLEVTREIARKINEKYGLNFPLPTQFKTEGHYIPSLTGEGKMSKTIEGSYINLTDSLDTIQARLAAAPTDSGKGKSIPKEGGVANLLKLVEIIEGLVKRQKYEEQYQKEGIKYSELKESLAGAIYKTLVPIQEKRKYYEEKPEEVEKIIGEGAKKARVIARATLTEIKKAMGLMQ
jgi:tryptophanyl-tRNA synthetase